MVRIQTNRDRLFRLAESQHGVFTTKQAVAVGYGRKTHAYQVKAGHWLREHRGIYRLAHYHLDEESEYAIWSLWACNREGKPQGVYSHQTALAIFELSDINPSKLHMTVPRTFRRSSEIPPHLVLHDGALGKDAIEEREGYRLTTPLQTIHDVCHEASISRDLVKQAISEAVIKGLISQREKKAAQNSSELPEWARRIFNDLE